MGFLKFLKREKKNEGNELDLPPAPPSLEGFEEHDIMPGLEDTKISAGAQDLDLPQEHDFDFSKDMDFDLDNDAGKGDKMPEFPEMTDFEEDTQKTPHPAVPVAPLQAPVMDIEEPGEAQEEDEHTAEPQATDYQKAAKRYLFPERRHARQQTFVKVDRLKSVLDNISRIRSDLRKSEEALLKLENMKGSKDRSYDKFKSSLDDLQKKLIFIDKTLFKGG